MSEFSLKPWQKSVQRANKGLLNKSNGMKFRCNFCSTDGGIGIDWRARKPPEINIDTSNSA